MNHGATGPRIWTVRVITLFPGMFPGPLAWSLAGKALENGVWALETVDMRDFAGDKHRSVDDSPFGGGPGMIMRPDVLDAALTAARESAAHESAARESGEDHGHGRFLYLSPRGRRLDQPLVRELAAEPRVTLLCGRYEGIDERVIAAHRLEEVSLGDLVLSGGEPAALALIDACVRLLPGVMGNLDTAGEESFERGLLEYPHYTRPALWTDLQGVERAVPEVLLSGHHGQVAAWRLAEAERITRERRPDLWEPYARQRQAEQAERAARVRKRVARRQAGGEAAAPAVQTETPLATADIVAPSAGPT